MRAFAITAPSQGEVREVPVPVPGAGEVVVQVAYTGICGTDYHIWKGDFVYTRFPLTNGHEFSGVVSAVGPGRDRLEGGRPSRGRPDPRVHGLLPLPEAPDEPLRVVGRHRRHDPGCHGGAGAGARAQPLPRRGPRADGPRRVHGAAGLRLLGHGAAARRAAGRPCRGLRGGADRVHADPHARVQPDQRGHGGGRDGREAGGGAHVRRHVHVRRLARISRRSSRSRPTAAATTSWSTARASRRSSRGCSPTPRRSRSSSTSASRHRPRGSTHLPVRRVPPGLGDDRLDGHQHHVPAGPRLPRGRPHRRGAAAHARWARWTRSPPSCRGPSRPRSSRRSSPPTGRCDPDA